MLNWGEKVTANREGGECKRYSRRVDFTARFPGTLFLIPMLGFPANSRQSPSNVTSSEMLLSPCHSDKMLHTGALNCDHSANSLTQCFYCYKGRDVFSG